MKKGYLPPMNPIKWREKKVGVQRDKKVWAYLCESYGKVELWHE